MHRSFREMGDGGFKFVVWVQVGGVGFRLRVLGSSLILNVTPPSPPPLLPQKGPLPPVEAKPGLTQTEAGPYRGIFGS